MTPLVFLLIGLSNAAIRISDDEIYELTPFGYWLSDCFHGARAGAHIENFDDHFTVDGVKIPRCHTPHNSTYINERIAQYLKDNGQQNVGETGNGWQAYVKMDAEENVNMFNGNWVVPPLPVKKSAEEVLYTFTALQFRYTYYFCFVFK